MVIKLIMRMQCFIFVFPDLDTVTPPSPPPPLSICLTKVSRIHACSALYKPDEPLCAYSVKYRSVGVKPGLILCNSSPHGSNIQRGLCVFYDH